MEFLGIGPMELLLIILLAIIIFGPKDIAKAGKEAGKALNKLIRSDTWKTINQTTQELKDLPTKLMREASLDEGEKTSQDELNKVDQTIHPPAPILPTPETPPEAVKAQSEKPDLLKTEPPDEKTPE